MIIERFEQHVKNNPGKLAVKSAARTLTYNELNRLSKAVAAKIESLSDGIPKGAVGIMSDEPAEMIAGILGILRSGNIYVPMVNDFPPKRLAYIIRHAGTRLIVADQKNRERILTACDNPGDTRFILTEELESVGDDMNSNTGQTQTREVFTDTGASLLFTSGSTGFPKGVLQTHRNISYFIDRYTQNLGVTSSDNMTLFASFSHDVTLLDMYSSLLSGATLFPLDLKEDDVFASLPQWLETRKITVWHSVPTVYRYFIAGLSGPLHLPHIRRIVLGGEAVTESDIEKFNNYFDHCPQCQLYTLYGQTESSYNSGSHYPPGAPTKDITITLGDINTGTEMFIVDEKGGEVEALETGEIIVQGHHISPGYWKDEEKTREKFFDDPESGRIYFTGDLGRRLLDGRIEFLGRKDNQVKLRGFRIELEEIEHIIMQHDIIVEAAVVPVSTSSQEKFLACYYVAVSDFDLKYLFEFLRERLPDHMIPSYFKQLRKLPVTVSGKVDKNALPAPEVTPEHEYVPPRTATEKQLVGIWSDILQLGRDVIGIDSNFFQMGGHSLRATTLTSRIHKEMEVKVPLSVVFELQTIKEQAEYIEFGEKKRLSPIPPLEKRDYYEVSPVQQNYYDLQNTYPDKTYLNMAYFFRFNRFDRDGGMEVLNESYRALIRRHEIFRTSFRMVNDQLVQQVHEAEDVPFEVNYIEAAPEEEAQRFHEFVTPFDLSKAPLLRATVLDTGERPLIMFDVHHIITDNLSLNLLEKDSMAILGEDPLPRLEVQYKDFAHWFNQRLQEPELLEQKEYWLNVFIAPLPALELPYDFPRPPKRNLDGTNIPVLLGKEETKKAKELALKTDATFFAVLLTAYYILFHKLSGQEDIIVGSTVETRRHPDLETMQGMLSNRIAMRNRPAANKTVKSFLTEVKENTLEDFENREYPHEEFTELFAPSTNPSRYPIFDVMFIMIDERLYQGDTAELGEQEVFLSHSDLGRADLLLVAGDRGDNVLLKFEYSTRLFKEETVKRFIRYYRSIVSQIADHPEGRLSEITI